LSLQKMGLIRMKKKGFLLLVSFIIILGLMHVASAVVANQFQYNVSLNNVTNNSAAQLTEFEQGFYLTNQSPGTYAFNISINNSFMFADTTVSGINFTNITIELPTGLYFLDHQNETQNVTSMGTGASDGLIINTNFTFSNVNSTQQFLYINFTPGDLSNTTVTHGGGGATSRSGVHLRLNVSVNTSAAVEEQAFITVRLSNNTVADENAVTINFTFNVTLDFTGPTLSAASTNSTLNQINVTFSELMRVQDVLRGVFNFTGFQVPSGSARRIMTTTVREGDTGNESNQYAIALNASYLANDTPVVMVNSTDVFDLAGNAISANSLIASISTGYSTANATAGDQAQPGLNYTGLVATGSSYNHFTGILILEFNESIDTSTFNSEQFEIASNQSNALAGVIINTSVTVNTGYAANILNLTLVSTDIDAISGLRAPGINISLNGSGIGDSSGNVYNSGLALNYSVNSYTNDTEAGNFSTVAYDEHTRTLRVTFNETIDTNTVVLSSVLLQNQSSTTNAEQTNISTATITKSTNSTVLEIVLTQKQADNVSIMVKGSDGSGIYLVNFTGGAGQIKDIGGNSLIELADANQTTIQSFTVKTSEPNLIVKPFFNATFGAIFSLDQVVKADVVNFSLNFNDSMADNNTGTVNITHAGGTVDTATCTNINRTNYNCTVTITTGDDGVANISISNFQLANGITVMPLNVTNTVVIDTVAPTLLRVGYRDNDYAGENVSFDNILLQFSENMTMVDGQNSRGNISRRLVFNGENETLNLTVVGDVFNGSVGNELANMQLGAYFRQYLNLSYINVSLNDTTNITRRGQYSATFNDEGNASGLRLQAGQDIIVDYAGNIAADNGIHDIADGIVEFDANLLKYFSVPFCVDQTEIDNQTTTETGTIKSYTNNAFTTVTSGTLNALYGYEANFTNDFNLYVYTKKQSECSLQEHSVGLNQNYSLLGIDNESRAASLRLFLSLGNGSKVAQLYSDPNNLGTTDASVAEFGDRNINPFGAFWIFPRDFTISTTPYTGLGIN